MFQLQIAFTDFQFAAIAIFFTILAAGEPDESFFLNYVCIFKFIDVIYK